MAVWPNLIVLESLVDPDFMRSVRHDARASDRTRVRPRGVSEATSQCEQGRIANAKCGPRARKRDASEAHVPHSSILNSAFGQATYPSLALIW